jgi:hypothetical protein
VIWGVAICLAIGTRLVTIGALKRKGRQKT